MKREKKELTDRILLPEMNPTLVAAEIGNFVVERVRAVGSTGCVIGLSGGVDSTTTASLIKNVFDLYNRGRWMNDRLELVGYILPSGTNAKDDAEDGIKVAEQLGIRYEVHDIEGVVKAYVSTNPEALFNDFHRGNLTSRVRANILNTKAATENKIVAGTGNKDEDYGIGYYTLFGDGAVHINPVGDLSKRLVRQMAEHLGFGWVAQREPTAGLEPGQTDFKDLGYSYDLVELVTEALDQGFVPQQLLRKAQVYDLVERDMRAYKESFGLEKFYCKRDLINDLIRRHENAKQKAQIVSPPVALVTLTYE